MAISPKLILTGDPTVGHPVGDGNVGPFEFGGALFVAVTKQDTATTNNLGLGILSSPDGGLTWTEQDSANAPVISAGGTTSVFYPSAGGAVIYCAFTNSADESINLVAFTMGSGGAGTYGTKITGGPISNFDEVQMAHRSDGTWVVQYGDSSNIYGVTYNGSWSVPTLFGVGDPNRIGMDASDNVLLLWQDNSTNNLWCTLYNGSFQAAFSAIADFSLTSSFAKNANRQGKYVSALDQVVWGVPLTGTAPFILKPSILIASTPASPSFTFPTVYTYSSADSGNEDVFAIDFAFGGGNYYLFWTYTTPLPDGFSQMVYVTATSLAGPWTGPTLYWDETADPPTPPPPVDGVDTVSVRVLSSTGLPGVVAGAWSFQGGANQCEAQYYLATGSTPPALSLACPVGGGTATIGVPYNKTLVPSGGAPPYTFRVVS